MFVQVVHVLGVNVKQVTRRFCRGEAPQFHLTPEFAAVVVLRSLKSDDAYHR